MLLRNLLICTSVLMDGTESQPADEMSLQSLHKADCHFLNLVLLIGLNLCCASIMAKFTQQ
jgi:hypothetical protein